MLELANLMVEVGLFLIVYFFVTGILFYGTLIIIVDPIYYIVNNEHLPAWEKFWKEHDLD